MTKRSRGEVGQSRRRSILAPPIGCHLVRRIATPSVNNGPPSSLSLSLSSPSNFISCPFVRFLIAGQRAAAASPHPSLPSDSIQLGRSSRLCNPTDLLAWDGEFYFSSSISSPYLFLSFSALFSLSPWSRQCVLKYDTLGRFV